MLSDSIETIKGIGAKYQKILKIIISTLKRI